MIKKKALVTGATGFIGSHLVKRLIEDNWDVHIIIRKGSNLHLLKSVLSRLTVHYFDGKTQRLISIIKHSKPNVVFHLASLFKAQHEAKDVGPLIQSNLLFATQLVEAMVENKVFAFVNTGTSWQHYKNESYDPVCLYAATKQAFETILKYYTEAYPLKVITLKLFDTYGPGDNRPKLFSLFHNAIKNKNSLLMSPGDQLIDIVFVSDVVDAFLLAANRILRHNIKSEDYAVSSGKPITLQTLVRLYEHVTGIKIPIKWGARPYRFREVMKPWNIGRTLPGWRPKIKLIDGIKRINGID
jgi:nucleoside-diphosphate-sugar epimerase